jgi:ribosomal protein L37AE/L43A
MFSRTVFNNLTSLLRTKGICPGCGGHLEKRSDTGEGIKHCTKCSSGWFILRTNKLRRE